MLNAPVRHSSTLALHGCMSREAGSSESALVNELTASAERAELSPPLLKALARACANDDAALRATFAALQRRLRADDARVRLRAALLTDHLFRRSRLFRGLITAWLPAFLLCVQGGAGAPLPPPRAAASRLHALAAKQLAAWCEGWGAHHPELHVALLRGAADLAAPAPRELPSAAEGSRARREARARELARVRYFSFRPSVEPLFAAVRSGLAQLDAAMALSSVPADGGPACDADCWEEVPAALPLVAGGGRQADASEHDAAVLEALRGVLRDLDARLTELRVAVTELGNTAVDDGQRVPLLQEALALKAAAEVALRSGAANAQPQGRVKP